MTTKYVITATTQHPVRTMANKKSAITEAENRARFLGFTEPVNVTTLATGKIVYTTHVIEPEPQPEPKPITENTKSNEDTATDKPSARRSQRRPALRPANQTGWEVLYEKKREHYELWRTEDLSGYALYCTNHKAQTSTIDTFRAVRDQISVGGWCSGCATTQAELADNDTDETAEAVELDDEDLKFLNAMNKTATEGGVWQPDAAGSSAPLKQLKHLEELGLVELVVNDPDNVWAYLTDKGDAVLAQ